MNHKNTIGYEIKTLDNLFFRNLLSYETSQNNMDEVTVMYGWILGSGMILIFWKNGARGYCTRGSGNFQEGFRTAEAEPGGGHCIQSQQKIT